MSVKAYLRRDPSLALIALAVACWVALTGLRLATGSGEVLVPAAAATANTAWLVVSVRLIRARMVLDALLAERRSS